MASESHAASAEGPGKKTKGRVKIKMEFIDNKLRRYTTFSKRKTGIMKKAYELSTLTGTQVMLLVASETGHVYTFATRKLQPMITSEAGKELIQTCLNSPDPVVGSPTQPDQRMSATGFEEPDLTYTLPTSTSATTAAVPTSRLSDVRSHRPPLKLDHEFLGAHPRMPSVFPGSPDKPVFPTLDPSFPASASLDNKLFNMGQIQHPQPPSPRLDGSLRMDQMANQDQRGRPEERKSRLAHSSNRLSPREWSGVEPRESPADVVAKFYSERSIDTCKSRDRDRSVRDRSLSPISHKTEIEGDGVDLPSVSKPTSTFVPTSPTSPQQAPFSATTGAAADAAICPVGAASDQCVEVSIAFD